VVKALCFLRAGLPCLLTLAGLGDLSQVTAMSPSFPLCKNGKNASSHCSPGAFRLGFIFKAEPGCSLVLPALVLPATPLLGWIHLPSASPRITGPTSLSTHHQLPGIIFFLDNILTFVSAFPPGCQLNTAPESCEGNPVWTSSSEPQQDLFQKEFVQSVLCSFCWGNDPALFFLEKVAQHYFPWVLGGFQHSTKLFCPAFLLISERVGNP
jgi:hypothetical protein